MLIITFLTVLDLLEVVHSGVHIPADTVVDHKVILGETTAYY